MLTASDSSGTIKKEDAQSRVTKYRDFYGKIIQFKYDTYGKVIKRTGTTNTPFQYNGRDGVMTDENGLLYMRSRYYSPELKRFLNADIVKGDVSHSATLNQYAYVNGNPISYVDPFGTSADQGSGTQNYEKVIDYLQTALDIIGFIPGYGDIADLINALIYAVRGDWANAGLSALAIIPMLGSLGTGTKLGGKALGKVDDVWALLKNNDGFADLGKLAGKNADEAGYVAKSGLNKIKNNKEANKVAKLFGYEGAEKLKQDFVFNEGAKFNMMHDSNTGEIVLVLINDSRIKVSTGLFK